MLKKIKSNPKYESENPVDIGVELGFDEADVLKMVETLRNIANKIHAHQETREYQKSVFRDLYYGEFDDFEVGVELEGDFFKKCDTIRRGKDETAELRAIDEIRKIVDIMEKDIKGELSEAERKSMLERKNDNSLEALRQYFEGREM